MNATLRHNRFHFFKRSNQRRLHNLNLNAWRAKNFFDRHPEMQTFVNAHDHAHTPCKFAQIRMILERFLDIINATCIDSAQQSLCDFQRHIAISIETNSNLWINKFDNRIDRSQIIDRFSAADLDLDCLKSIEIACSKGYFCVARSTRKESIDSKIAFRRRICESISRICCSSFYGT